MNGSWVATLGWTLLHFLWQGTAVAVIYAGLRALLRRSLAAQGRYLLACLALAAMTAAPVITYFALPRGVTPSLVSSFIVWTVPAETWQRMLPVWVALWMAGVTAFSIRVLGGWRLVARLRRASQPAEAFWQGRLEEIAAKVKTSRPVRLLVSPLVDVPMVIGWLRPVVLVPLGALTGLPAEHVHALLAHELAHIRRHDYLAGILQNIAETLLFYHPAVWWVSGEIRDARELCCDDVAVAASGDVLIYARALTQMESLQAPRLDPALGANGGSLLLRIRRLIEPDLVADHLPGPGSAGAMTLLCLAGIGIATIHVAQRPGPLKHIVNAARTLVSVTAKAAPEMARAGLMFDPFLPTTKPEPQQVHRREWSGDGLVVRAVSERKTIALPSTDDGGLQATAWTAPFPDSMKGLGTATVNTLSEIPVAPEAPEGIIRSSTHLVQVQVVVRTSKGPVTGLTADDFQIFDNGRERTIGTFSSAATASVTPAVTVVFWDRAGASTPGDMAARQRVLEALREMPASAQFAICTLDSEFRVISQNADTPAQRAEAVKNLPSMNGTLSRHSASDRLGMLEAIAGQLAKLPGRKNLLWVGSEFHVATDADNWALHMRMGRVLRSMNAANIALFPLSVEGVVAPKLVLDFMIPGQPNVQQAQRAAQAAVIQPGFDLRFCAEQTDGYAALNTDLGTALKRIFADEMMSYTLGFYPESLDGGYHNLRVQTSVKNADVRSRQGYLAVARPEAALLMGRK